jgi:hypothetical protein
MIARELRWRRLVVTCCLVCSIWILLAQIARADKPYFVAYDAEMEEPGNFEISFNPVLSLPHSAPNFLGGWTEFEYGVKGWWTTEFYLDGQTTSGQSTLFTGYRWENRFRPLADAHRVNPVLYVEFENIDAADKALTEVVNHDSVYDLAVPNGEARLERQHEIETKLILSSDYKGWNFSENFIGEKNLAHEPWEFGYALGASRPLGLAASSERCDLCSENFRAGVELYGGLGTWNDFGFHKTAHYLGPLLAWDFPGGASFRISPTFGLTSASARFLLRFGVSYEFQRIDRAVRRLLR